MHCRCSGRLLDSLPEAVTRTKVMRICPASVFRGQPRHAAPKTASGSPAFAASHCCGARGERSMRTKSPALPMAPGGATRTSAEGGGAPAA